MHHYPIITVIKNCPYLNFKNRFLAFKVKQILVICFHDEAAIDGIDDPERVVLDNILVYVSLVSCLNREIVLCLGNYGLIVWDKLVPLDALVIRYFESLALLLVELA